MYLVIDRFEGEMAICQNPDSKEICRLHKKRLPPEAKEGDILHVGKESIAVDRDKTRQRARQLEALLRELKK